jgi:vesicle transport through interaction with t-SNAREs protein 1
MLESPFERYDAEFLSLMDQVKSRLRNASSLPSNSPTTGVASSTEADMKYTQGLLSQCDDLLKQMQVEARTADSSTKQVWLQKVRGCKAQLANLRDDFQTVQSKVEREALLLLTSNEDTVSSSDYNNRSNNSNNKQRERLLQTNNQLKKQNQTLENAQRILVETEEVAMEITTELGRNREKIASAHQRVRDVSGLTNQARRIVQSMSKREVQQKLLMYLVAALLVIAVIVILYAMGS